MKGNRNKNKDRDRNGNRNRNRKNKRNNIRKGLYLIIYYKISSGIVFTLRFFTYYTCINAFILVNIIYLFIYKGTNKLLIRILPNCL